MPRDIPDSPKLTWVRLLETLDREFGSAGTFTSKDAAELLDITIFDASNRFQRLRRWDCIKHVSTRRHNQKVYIVTNYGRRVLAKKGE